MCGSTARHASTTPASAKQPGLCLRSRTQAARATHPLPNAFCASLGYVNKAPPLPWKRRRYYGNKMAHALDDLALTVLLEEIIALDDAMDVMTLILAER